MVKKFVYGTPFETEAVVKEIPSSEGTRITVPSPPRTASPSLQSLLTRTWYSDLAKQPRHQQTRFSLHQ